MSENKDLTIKSENMPDSVPYIVHEGEMARLEAIHKEDKERSDKKFNRLFWLCIVIFAAFILTNAGWLFYESQFEEVSTSVTQEVSSEGGGDAIINGDRAGAVFYGESEADGDNEDALQEDGR